MAEIYWIGVFLGLGVGIGVLLAGLFGRGRPAMLAAVALAAVAGFALGIWLGDEPEAAAAAIGGIFGAVSAAEILGRALARGGERLGMALIGIAAGAAAAGLAFIPVVGYLEALALPILAARIRRSGPDRYAGLRTLARD